MVLAGLGEVGAPRSQPSSPATIRLVGRDLTAQAGLTSVSARGADLLGAGQAAMLPTARRAYTPALLSLSLVCSDGYGASSVPPSVSVLLPTLGVLLKSFLFAEDTLFPSLALDPQAHCLSLHTSGHQLLPHT